MIEESALFECLGYSGVTLFEDSDNQRRPKVDDYKIGDSILYF